MNTNTHDFYPSKDAGPKIEVMFCMNCAGHIGVAGSPGEHCENSEHTRETDQWNEQAVRFWTRTYARDAQIRRIRAEDEARRLAIPLIKRLKDCGVRPANDGVMSIHPPAIEDAHEAADVIETLLEVATRLATGNQAQQAAACVHLAEIQHSITTGSGTI